jgi:3-isopropylmalate/(R)-2-methylmalate dehydratase large subunit
MGQTMVEKIISRKLGRTVRAGDYVIVEIDKMFVHEGSGPLAIRQADKFGRDRIVHPERILIFRDHASPAFSRELANDQRLLQDFAHRTGARIYGIGDGICHSLMSFNEVNPGEIIVGGDSHSTTGGALGAFATGMGSTDIGVAMVLGQTWIKVPDTIKFELQGDFPHGVFAKDLILHIIGLVGSEGATYKSMEFGGPAAWNLPVHDRITITNMAVEAGAKNGVFPSDETTRTFLAERGRSEKYQEVKPDPDATYEKVITIALDDLEPTVACPHQVDNICSVNKVQDIKIDQAFLGTCTNGYLEDLRIAAGIIARAGGQFAPDVRFILNPGTREIYEQAMSEGLLQLFSKAGAAINPAGCGVCPGSHQGVLADGEVAIGSNNRNFKGRFGNPNASVYLGSPATVAASAITGKVTDPRRFLS